MNQWSVVVDLRVLQMKQEILYRMAAALKLYSSPAPRILNTNNQYVTHNLRLSKQF